MGDRRFEREVLIKRVEGIRCLVQALSSLNDPHMEFTLLQSCFSLPEFSFSMAFWVFDLRGVERRGAAAYLASVSASQKLVRVMWGMELAHEL